MTAAEIHAKAYDLVAGMEEIISVEKQLLLAQAIATLEVAAQLAELNERLAHIASWDALRIERKP